MKRHYKPIIEVVTLIVTILFITCDFSPAISVRKFDSEQGSSLGREFYNKLTNELKDTSIYGSKKEFLEALRLIKSSEYKATINKIEQLLKKNPASPIAHEILGVALIMSGDTDKGLKSLEKAVRLNPAQVSAIIKIGFVHLSRKEVDKARVEFEKAIKLDPKNSKAHQWLGMIYEKDKKFKKAITHFEKGLIGVPAGYVGIKVNLARLYNFSARFEESVQLLGGLVGKNMKNTGAHVVLGAASLGLNKTDSAITEFEIARKLEPENEKIHLSLGIAYRTKKDYPKSLEELREAIRIKPKWAAGYYQLGETFFKMKKTDQALENYRQAVKLSKDSFFIKKRIAGLFLSQKEFSKAIPIFKDMIKSKNAGPKIYDLLGSSYQMDSQMDMAEKTFKEAAVKFPKKHYSYTRLGLFYVALKEYEQAIAQFNHGLLVSPDDPGISRLLRNTYNIKGDLRSAIETARAIIKIHPDSIPDMFYLATLYYDENKITETKKLYRRIISIKPGHVPALNNLAALISEDGGNLDEALNLVRKAASIAPKSGEIGDTLGWVLFKQKKFKESIEALKMSASLSPGHPTILFHLGMAYYMNDQAKEALRQFDRALESSTPFPEHDEALNMKKKLAVSKN